VTSFEQRQKKLEQIQALGFEAFSREEFRWSHTAAELVKGVCVGPSLAELGSRQKGKCALAGRNRFLSSNGKRAGFRAFAGRRESGIQIYRERKTVVGERGFSNFFQLLDLGDPHWCPWTHVSARKTGELSVWGGRNYFFLSKALLPFAGEVARAGGYRVCAIPHAVIWI